MVNATLQGMRVLGLATKSFERLPKDLSREDEAEMVFRGFLAFLDPPKDCAIPCIRELHARGIAVKVRGHLRLLCDSGDDARLANARHCRVKGTVLGLRISGQYAACTFDHQYLRCSFEARLQGVPF